MALEGVGAGDPSWPSDRERAVQRLGFWLFFFFFAAHSVSGASGGPHPQGRIDRGPGFSACGLQDPWKCRSIRPEVKLRLVWNFSNISSKTVDFLQRLPSFRI